MALNMRIIGKSHMVATLRRTFTTTAALNGAIRNVVVIGGGLMGSGIAQVVIFYKILSLLPLVCL